MVSDGLFLAPLPDPLQVSLGRLRDEFLARLPQRLADLRALLAALEAQDAEALATLRRGAHSLVGVAGLHGLPALADAARQLEQTAAGLMSAVALTQADRQALQQALTRLNDQAALPLPAQASMPLPPPSSVMPRILLAVASPALAQPLRAWLEAADYQVDTVTQPQALRAACLDAALPAAVVVDMDFPGVLEDGAAWLQSLKERSLGSLPVVFLSERSDFASRLAAYRAGATRCLTKPVDRDAFMRQFGRLQAQLTSQPYRVLLVDDDTEQLAAYADILRQAGMEVRTLDDPLQAPQTLQAFAAEVLVLDMYMPACSGPELAAILGGEDLVVDLPIIYLSAESDVSRQLLALDRGGDHFLTKPVEPRHLVSVVSRHVRRLRQTREQAQALRESFYERERQQAALNAHAIVSVADASGTILYANDNFCTVSGYSRAELIGQNHRIVRSNTHPPAFYADMWATISQGRIWQGEVCNRAKDGDLYWVETTIVPFMDAQGLPYQYVSVRTDVTQVMQAEEKLRRLFERVPGLVFELRYKPDGRIEFLFINDAVRDYFGLAADQVCADAALLLGRIHPDDRTALAESTRQAARELTRWQLELRVFDVHDQMRWLTVEAVPERQDSNVLWYGYAYDSTERRQQARALSDALVAAESASRAKSEFLASMSHELRTPLNAIIGFSQIFGLDPQLDAETRSHAGEIEHAGNHLLSLVNGLIDLARIESGQMTLSMEPLALDRVLGEARAMVAPMAVKHGVAVLGDVQTCQTLHVQADYTRLSQVLINLLSNAIKYNRPQGQVRLRCQTQGGRVRISVEDTGPGIAADKQDRIFHAFDRLGAELGTIEGTGIGLVLTKRMVEAMGGAIGFVSTAGQGSTFWVEFDALGAADPVPSDVSSVSTPAALAPDAPACAATARLPEVLYIEDNPMNLRLMRQIFSRRKDLVLRDAHTAEVGLDMARAAPPTLILMDINLPGMDGYQALAALQADARTAHIPVLAVTANAMKGDAERARAAGFVDYVAKPLNVVHFMEQLDRLLAQRTEDKA